MSQPDTNMVGKLADLIDTEWEESNVPRRNLIIDKSDNIGKGRDIGTYDYIEMSLTSPLSIEYADLFRSSQDVDTAVFVELKASTEDRRDALFTEFRRVIEANDSRPDTPGDHDRMNIEDITPLDDDNFGAYLTEMVITFESRARDKGV